MDPKSSQGLLTRTFRFWDASTSANLSCSHTALDDTTSSALYGPIVSFYKGCSWISILEGVWESFLLMQAFIFAKFMGLHVPDWQQTTNLYLFIFQHSRNCLWLVQCSYVRALMEVNFMNYIVRCRVIMIWHHSTWAKSWLWITFSTWPNVWSPIWHILFT